MDAYNTDVRTSCLEARGHADLLRIFADLPALHPALPGAPGRSTTEDEDIPPLAIAVAIALLAGLPIAVVLGFTYDAWWTLVSVPVTLSVVMVYIEHLVSRERSRPEENS